MIQVQKECISSEEETKFVCWWLAVTLHVQWKCRIGGGCSGGSPTWEPIEMPYKGGVFRRVAIWRFYNFSNLRLGLRGSCKAVQQQIFKLRPRCNTYGKMSSDSSEEPIPRKRKKQACRSGFQRRRKIICDSNTSSENDEHLSPEQRLDSVHAKISGVDARLICCLLHEIIVFIFYTCMPCCTIKCMPFLKYNVWLPSCKTTPACLPARYNGFLSVLLQNI